MKKNILVVFLMLYFLMIGFSKESQKTVFPGADENTPSRAQYFSWINNTNEGATEQQTSVNLEFFRWLHDEFDMILDIYAFDAGAIDGKRFYGRVDSDRFRKQFPKGFGPLYRKAKAMGTRLGVWGGPDGFGDTPEEEKARIDQMVSLCRDFEFALFKFDAVCGPLRPGKEDAFIRMMKLCREYSPDLILLNHRLGLERAQQYATTFLWEGRETYIDVFSTNRVTAPHHRADAISRGLPPGLKRFTEDHGVCLSSCLDYWQDDLILQAFNRCLILSPQLYGNPWLLRDDEFPKLARIYNLHRRYRDILTQGMTLPKKRYGPFAVSRGNGNTRLITLRNLTWQPVQYTIKLDKKIGISAKNPIEVRQFFPCEKIIGRFAPGSKVPLTVQPFRACLLLATVEPCPEIGISGCEYEVVRDTPEKPVKIKLLGLPGQKSSIKLLPGGRRFVSAAIDGIEAGELLEGKAALIEFPGKKLRRHWHREPAEMSQCKIPKDAEALYEATVFAADNNALEVRCLSRSGPSRISYVRKARQAFFIQPTFVKRGVWDANLFDGDRGTGFWPSRKYLIDRRVKNGCLRLDLGRITDVDQIILHVPDEYSLQPLLAGEGNHVEVSADLRSWQRLTYLAGKRMVIELPEPVRYLRFRYFPDRIVEIEGLKASASGESSLLSREGWRASNLFAHPGRMKPVKAWSARVKIDEWIKGSYFCIALEGEHGVEGAYAALKVDGKLVGCPDRAASYPANTWEYVNARRDKNYTYYAPITKDMIGKNIEVYVLAYEKKKTRFRPRVWVTAYPTPYEEKLLELK
ncbi:MAG: hypothetical protein KAW12_13240 [Candidatus Aminicenantes bacterium]|nr:hypothetical protein [Candidatus Aminicenantes bacterium]